MKHIATFSLWLALSGLGNSLFADNSHAGKLGVEDSLMGGGALGKERCTPFVAGPDLESKCNFLSAMRHSKGIEIEKDRLPKGAAWDKLDFSVKDEWELDLKKALCRNLHHDTFNDCNLCRILHGIHPNPNKDVGLERAYRTCSLQETRQLAKCCDKQVNPHPIGDEPAYDNCSNQAKADFAACVLKKTKFTDQQLLEGGFLPIESR